MNEVTHSQDEARFSEYASRHDEFLFLEEVAQEPGDVKFSTLSRVNFRASMI